MNLRAKFSLLVFALATALPGAAQTRASLSTNDTAVVLAAEEDAPRVVSLGTWINSGKEQPITSVEQGGRTRPLKWHFRQELSHRAKSRIDFVYECQAPHLRLTWTWEAKKDFGPLEHSTKIENLEQEELWLPLTESVQFRFREPDGVNLEHVFVEKGADTPSPIGTHREQLSNNYYWVGHSTTYSHPGPGEPREIIPWLLVRDKSGTASGWYIGMEFSGRVRMSLDRAAGNVTAIAGLDPEPGPARTRLKPGESFVTPTVFVGAFQGDVDDAGNILRSWVKRVLMNPGTWNDDRYPLLTNNSWGAGMDINEEKTHAMIADAAGLGLEMFHGDAGWFRGVADWYADPKKFPHGMTALADYAHGRGLRFGLWVDWTQAALDTQPGALNALDASVRDWLVADLPAGWKPEPFKGQTIDLGDPPAAAWASKEVERIVSDYHLDMLEHDGYVVAQGCSRTDHPHAPPDTANMKLKQIGSSTFVESSNSTDVSYHAVAAYYAIYKKLRRQHPELLLEACNDGGRMVDFGTAAHVDYFSITDTYDPLSNRRAYYDTSHVLPAPMLETYVEKWPTPTMENFRYMLRSGMMGWLTLMLDTTAWTEQQHAVAKQEIDFYKSYLRPLIRNADLYHASPRPDGIHWDGIELFDRNTRQGVLYAFRGSTTNEGTHIFPIRGVRADREYKITLRDARQTHVVSGKDLLQQGIRVASTQPYTSELVLIQEKRD